MILKLHVQPGASRDEVVGWDGETLRLRIRARAIEGKANRSVEAFLAEALGLRPRQVTLLRGERSRDKLVEVEMGSLEEIALRLGQQKGSRL